MHSTGPIESWAVNPVEVGPIYPFAGWEWLMLAGCLAFCAFFLVWKFRTESAAYAARVERLHRSGELADAVANQPRSV